MSLSPRAISRSSSTISILCMGSTGHRRVVGNCGHLANGNAQRECTSLARLAFQQNSSAVQFRYVLCNGQTYPASSNLLHGSVTAAVELVKDPRPFFLRNADPQIRDCKIHETVCLDYADRYLLVFAGVF